MKINKKQEGSKLVIALEGRLDTTSAPDLEKELPALRSSRFLWGKMVLHGKLGNAYVYAHIYQLFLSIARKILRILRQI